MNQNQMILNLAVSMGEAMLQNGGEIYRVEDTVTHILTAYGITDYNVFVISNGIFATVNETGPSPSHMVRHVPLCGMNLQRICALNQLSREICASPLPIDTAMERLKEAAALSPAPLPLQIFCCGAGSGAFCYLLGGSLLDTIPSFFLGSILQFFLSKIAAKTSRFIPNILGSALVTFLSLLLMHSGLPFQQDKVGIGAIITLVPGVSFTTSIREFFNGDYLSGTIHLIDALLTALCIAIGVGSAVTLHQLLTGGLSL